VRVFVIGTRGIPDVLGGVETHCQNLYPLLLDQGFSVTLIARSPYVDYKESNYKGVSLRAIWASKKVAVEATLHTFLSVLYARLKSADLVHIHAIGPGLMVPFCKMLGLKVVFTHHGPDYDRQKWGWFASSILKLGERFAIHFSDEVIVISTVIEEILKEKYDFHRSHLIYNGVSISKINNIDYKYFLDKYELGKNGYIVAVGRFVEEKGFHDLLDAYSTLKTNCKLVIVGDSDHETAYSKKLKEKALNTPNVILTGFIKKDELVAIFSSARLFVMSSYHEGLPIALLEAMSYGLPVLVSDIPANLAVGLDKEDYYSVGDHEILARMIKEKLSSPRSIMDYSKYLALYDWNKIANKTASVYRQLSRKPQ